ncbi:hypothetical protein DTO207G8_2322 [Paecilomyces variotii]|nr:hypothetical protein DTO207G8_2322 [Paecilomyces variotii]
MPQKFREYAYDPSAGAAIVAILVIYTPDDRRIFGNNRIRLSTRGISPESQFHKIPLHRRNDGESRSIISRRWLTKIFVLGDVISLFLQAIGGVLITQKDADKIDHGKKIVDAGLFTQIASFGFFVVTATAFHIRLTLNPTAASLTKNHPWRKHIYTLYVTSILILVRCIVRVVEYLQGVSGYIMTHEVFIYVFDFLLMFIVMVIFNIIHPSEIYAILRGGGKVSKYCRTKQYDIAMLERRELETVETGQVWEGNALR